ncbi:precorrin-2 dehydrogenase [Caloramator mitchellensis]|uniref:precorrin-2 dehydrogenase n=1 Tax=Caloramator mitchellensis TaxID=908809 RepID=A0A0R3JZA9_CALMK|nr:NAD(P)-dependent oxidoreductase [Caloramator mitchellensis]KRQ85909.1 precorrin-2 dehydrogenase [Caloramator mitchellensis]
MQEDNREDFQGMNFISLTLLSDKIRAGIIGAGRAGLIKTKSFIKNNVSVEVLSNEFLDEFYELKSDKLKLIKGEYKSDFLKDKHIVVIAVDGDVKDKIRDDCERQNKIYIDCSNFKDGNALMPMQGRTKNIYYSVNTFMGNPRASVFLSDRMHNFLMDFDEFVGFTSNIRSKANINRKDIMNFLNSRDFYFMYRKGKHNLVLKLFLEDCYD